MTSIEQALEWHRAGQLEHAERAYRDLLAENSRNADAANLLGLILANRGEIEGAISLYRVAVDEYPNNASFLLNYASALARTGNREESRQAYDRALALQPESSETNAQYGLFLAQINEFADAEPFLRRSVEFDPNNSALRVNFGNALKALGKLDESHEQITQALDIDGENPFAWNSLGEILQLLGRDDESLEAFGRAVEYQPGNPKFQANFGLALSNKGRLTDANKAFDEALKIDPDNASFLASYAALKRDAGELSESLELFARALKAKPNDATIVSKYLYTLNFASGLSGEDIEREHMLINRCFEVDPALRRASRGLSNKIRIGFLSGDFRAHSVAYFLLPLLERIDRSQFEIVCYSQTTHEDSVTNRFARAADIWRPIFGLETHVVGDLIQEDEIDILIDVAGHTAGARLDVLANKPAPVLLNWLGYPNKVGLETFDGRIVDENTDPKEMESDVLDEPLFRMDRAFLAYEPPYDLPEIAETPALEKSYVTFGSFNNAAKLSDETIHTWKSILENVPSSRLLLKSWQFGDEETKERYIDRLSSESVTRDRIELIGRTESYEAHMALYGEVDIALDPFPYNGTTTTCEALWMGLPVVVREGTRHASRVGVSLLTSAGEKDLIASSVNEYIELAVSLAKDVDDLSRKRKSRRKKLVKSELGDLDAFARSFESLLSKIHTDLGGEGEDLNQWIEEGITLHRKGDLKGAITKYEAVLRKEPNRGDASHYCGVARYALGEYGEAVRLLDRATIELPDRSDVWTHYGSALLESGRSDEAVAAQEKALELDPADGTILNNYGNALTNSGRAEEALLVYKRSLEARPDDAMTWCNYSAALKSSGHLVKAVEAAVKATELDAQFAGAWSSLGVALVSIGEANRGVEAFRRAIDIQPTNSWNWSNLIFALQYSDTTTLDVLSGACHGFSEKFEGLRKEIPVRAKGESLRVGFVSSDFREHAVARFVLPLVEQAKNNRIETVLYSDTTFEDVWTEKLKKAATLWRSIAGRSNAGVASQIHQDELDALIDLGGHSSKNRLMLFASKPVGFQATWLGFPGSSGLTAMDARIADSISVTETEENLFPERIIRLSEGYHTIDLPDSVEVDPPPSSKGKPFTFGSFNNLSKASPTTIRLWADVLKAVPESRLLLKAYQLKDSGMREKIVEEFESLGIDSERLEFRDPIGGYEEHLRCYADVDVALDTFPYNGTTTTCEALWMGVPVVSLMGDRCASRVGASLLSQVGLGDFVAKTSQGYIELATRLTEIRGDLSNLRNELRDRVRTSSLGDARLFAGFFFDGIREGVRIAHETAESGSENSLLKEDWIECIDFGNGRSTAGDLQYPEEYDMLPSELSGQSVLDASCIDGFWCVKAVQRGAERVVAIPALGFDSPDENGNVTTPRIHRFEACRNLLSMGAMEFEMREKSIHQLGELNRTFDWVVWFINSNFHPEPERALAAVRSICRKGFCLSVTLEGKKGDDDMPWRPTKDGLFELLKKSGFEIESYNELDAGNGAVIALVRCIPV